MKIYATKQGLTIFGWKYNYFFKQLKKKQQKIDVGVQSLLLSMVFEIKNLNAILRCQATLD